MMFHYEEKLKDLKVEWDDDEYVISYKSEKAYFVIENNISVRAILTYINANEDVDSAEVELRNSYHITVGDSNLKRDVYHFSTPNGILPTLRCGFTVHSGENTWSSTPHSFELKPELGFEEVFLYLLGNGRWSANAIQIGQGDWENGKHINDIWRVSDRDISAIPMGYHPVVGEPGVHVSYIWAYLAKKPEWEKLP